jgi:hypothetical protein
MGRLSRLAACSAVLGMASTGLAACSQVDIDPTIRATDLVTVVPALVTGNSRGAVTGVLSAEEGCVILDGENGEIFLVAVARGFALSADGSAIASGQAGHSVALGDELSESTGVVVSVSELSDVDGAEGVDACEGVAERAVVFWDLEGLPTQE